MVDMIVRRRVSKASFTDPLLFKGIKVGEARREANCLYEDVTWFKGSVRMLTGRS